MYPFSPAEMMPDVDRSQASQDRNVEVVRAALAAAAEMRPDRMIPCYHPDVVWHFRGGPPALQGDYRGLDQFMGVFAVRVFALTRGTFRPEPVSIHAAGQEHVHAHVIIRGVVDGRDLELTTAMTYRLEGGRIVEVWDLVERMPDSLPDPRPTSAIRVLGRVFVTTLRQACRSSRV